MSPTILDLPSATSGYLCMDKALEQTGASEELVEMLKIPLFRIADAVRNKQGPSSAATNPNIIAAG